MKIVGFPRPLFQPADIFLPARCLATLPFCNQGLLLPSVEQYTDIPSQAAPGRGCPGPRPVPFGRPSTTPSPNSSGAPAASPPPPARPLLDGGKHLYSGPMERLPSTPRIFLHSFFHYFCSRPSRWSEYNRLPRTNQGDKGWG